MRYRTHGRTNLKVSRLGYGVMRLPAVDGQVDMDASCEVLRKAYECGITFFDSHHNYHDGMSEVAIGEALGDVIDKVVIQTKCPFYAGETKEKTYRSQLETALKKVKRDTIDILLAHSVRQDAWEQWGERFLTFARQARDEGLIRHIGFSSHERPEYVVELIETGDFDAILLPFNLVQRQYGPCLARARELGMGTACMNPVGGGRLAPPNPELLGMLDRPVSSTVELAMRFAFANDDINVVLSGMTKPEWVEQNATICEAETYLTDDDMAELAKMLTEKQGLADLYCTGCGYCLPCPHGVDIPGNFMLMNMARLYGLTEWARTSYHGRLKATRENDTDRLRASACTQCGKCLSKCPNHIPIIDQLKQVHALLSGDDD